jgi:hypothetical protein
MLYGEDNPVDGAVLQVILRKAESIRKALGVSVPMPEDDNRITQAILNTVLLRGNANPRQGELDLHVDGFDDLQQDLDAKWESAREKAKRNRTIFAQNRLKPEQVMPEWERAFSVLGNSQDVQRFITRACDRLDAPLEKRKTGAWRAPLEHLPGELKERMESAGLLHLRDIDFQYPSAEGAEFIHRTHPLVSHIADYVAEQAMSAADTNLAARTGAIFTRDLSTKTTLYLLRLRSRLTIRRAQQSREMLAEEALALAAEGVGEPRLLFNQEALQLLQCEVTKNMPIERRDREVGAALDGLSKRAADFEKMAKQRAQQLLNDHRRVREAADARGEYQVRPQLPVDVIGVYVLVPDLQLF